MILREFQSDLETNYGAPVELLDFAKDPDPSRVHINDWVAEQTKQIIQVGIVMNFSNLQVPLNRVVISKY